MGRTRPNRVLIIVQNLPVPFDRRVWLEARSLRDAGYQVSVICPKGFGCTRSREVIERIHIYRYGLFEARSARVAFVLEFLWCWLRTFLLTFRVAFSRGFDVIHACNPPDTFFAIGRFYRLFGKRFLFDQHDICPELYVSKYPMDEGDAMHRTLLLLERWTYHAADAIVSTNDSYREIAVARGGVSRSQVFVVRSGPDKERIRIVPPDPQERHGARIVIGYLGTMAVQDGVDGLLRVFALIVHEYQRKDAHLVLIGGGAMLKQLKAMAQEHAIESFVTFTGRVPDGDRFCRILCSTDLCVSPDPPNPLNELSTMNKTLEYMAFGRPVVAYRLKETVVSGGDAVVYARPGDENDLALKILELMDDPRHREELGRRGRQRIEQHLGWEHSVPPLLDAYRFVLNGGQ